MSENHLKSTDQQHRQRAVRKRQAQIIVAAVTAVSLMGVLVTAEGARPPTSYEQSAPLAAASQLTSRPPGAALPVAPAAVPAITRPARSAARAVPATPGRLTKRSAADRQMVALVDDIVGAMEDVAPAGAPPGTWHNSDGCFRCDAGPGLALAGAAAVTGDARRRKRSIAIFDEIIAAQQRGDGSFGKRRAGSDIETMFFAAELGMATMVLRSDLDRAHRVAWTAAVAGAADFLVANKNLTWYTNGNVNVGNALVMALAARLTGKHRFARYYERALRFAISPPQRWKEFGVRYTKKPHRADGSDGKAYFAEKGSARAGYDPEYTMLQLDQLTRIFLTNGDARVMRLMNLILNKLLNRVNTTTMLLDTSRGTRHPTRGRKIPFDTSGLSAVVNLGGRKKLKPLLDDQIPMIAKSFRQYGPNQGGRMKYALGMITASIIMSQRGYADLP